MLLRRAAVRCSSPPHILLAASGTLKRGDKASQPRRAPRQLIAVLRSTGRPIPSTFATSSQNTFPSERSRKELARSAPGTSLSELSQYRSSLLGAMQCLTVNVFSPFIPITTLHYPVYDGKKFSHQSSPKLLEYEHFVAQWILLVTKAIFKIRNNEDETSVFTQRASVLYSCKIYLLYMAGGESLSYCVALIRMITGTVRGRLAWIKWSPEKKGQGHWDRSCDR